MQAEDLHVAPVITWWNDETLWEARLPTICCCTLTATAMPTFWRVRTNARGALAILQPAQAACRRSGHLEYPPAAKFLAESETLDAWVDIEKPFWWDVPMWLASGKVDSIGLANNHMCRARCTRPRRGASRATSAACRRRRGTVTGLRRFTIRFSIAACEFLRPPAPLRACCPTRSAIIACTCTSAREHDVRHAGGKALKAGPHFRHQRAAASRPGQRATPRSRLHRFRRRQGRHSLAGELVERGPCSGSGSRERRPRDRDGFTRTACFKPSGSASPSLAAVGFWFGRLRTCLTRSVSLRPRPTTWRSARRSERSTAVRCGSSLNGWTSGRRRVPQKLHRPGGVGGGSSVPPPPSSSGRRSWPTPMPMIGRALAGRVPVRGPWHCVPRIDRSRIQDESMRVV